MPAKTKTKTITVNRTETQAIQKAVGYVISEVESYARSMGYSFNKEQTIINLTTGLSLEFLKGFVVEMYDPATHRIAEELRFEVRYKEEGGDKPWTEKILE